MQKTLLILLSLVILTAPLLAQPNIQYGKNAAAGGTVQVNGTTIYYEIYGTGQPLLLLHGNGGSIGDRSVQIPEYAKRYKVIAIDSRCHGNSGCPSGDLTYEQMASDANALLDYLKIDSCYIWGHSDGGILALIMGYKYPKKVKKMLVTGANVQPDSTALFPELIEMMKMYPMIKDTVMQKHLKLMVEHPHVSYADLNRIKVPVLVMAGDRDAVREEHTLRIFQAIPNAQLCILPGTTHFIAMERPVLFSSLLLDFFEKPFSMPSTVQIARQMAQQMIGRQ